MTRKVETVYGMSMSSVRDEFLVQVRINSVSDSYQELCFHIFLTQLILDTDLDTPKKLPMAPPAKGDGVQGIPGLGSVPRGMRTELGDKLMSDAIRVGNAHSSVFDATKKQNHIDELRAMDNTADGASAAEGASKKSTLLFPAVKDVVFDDVSISDRLRTTLLALGALTPVCVYEKKMSDADRLVGQNRLLMSCKSKDNSKNKKRKRKYNNKKKTSNGDGEQIPFAKIFSEKEVGLVHRPEKKEGEKCNKNKRKKREKGGKRKKKNKGKEEEERNTDRGLGVQAYDRDGQPYHLYCKFLSSNIAYRIIGRDWTEFLRNNGLVVAGKKRGRKGKKPSPEAEGGEDQSISPADEPNGEHPKQLIDDVRIELWAFRSLKLKLGITDQPDGALGLVILHYHENDAAPAHVDVGHAASEEVQGASSGGVIEASQEHGATMPNVHVGVHEEVEVNAVDAQEVVVPAMADAAGAHGEAAPPAFDFTPKELDVVEALMLMSTMG